MVGANIFPQRRGFTVNYDWTDIADLTGYVNYNVIDTIDSVGTIRHLVPSSIAANHTLGISAGDTGVVDDETFTKGIDFDFDLSESQLPRTLKGKALFRMAFTNYGRNNSTSYAYAIVKIRKWDGAAETEIASVQSATDTNAAATGTNNVVQLDLYITVPLTLIKKGENIRLTVEFWGKGAGAAHEYRIVGPQDPTEGEIVLTLPFRLDL